MTDKREILIQRLNGLIVKSGRTPRALSLAIGANVSYVGQLLSGKGGMPSAERLRLLAEELQTTTTYLMGEVDAPEQPTSEVAFGEMRREWRGNRDERLPVYGTGYCDDLEVNEDDHVVSIEQTLFEPHHRVGLIERPAALRDARDAYAIYFHGSSMEPRFFQGEVGIVVPSPPPGPGDFVVVQLNNGSEDDVVHVLVKRLVRITSSYVELEQYNPQIVFRIDRRRVTRLHRILGPNQIFMN